MVTYKNDQRPLSFRLIKNHLLTGLSTFQAAVDNRRLIDYQAKFYNKAVDLAGDEDFKGYVIKGGADQAACNTSLIY